MPRAAGGVCGGVAVDGRLPPGVLRELSLRSLELAGGGGLLGGSAVERVLKSLGGHGNLYGFPMRTV